MSREEEVPEVTCPSIVIEEPLPEEREIDDAAAAWLMAPTDQPAAGLLTNLMLPSRAAGSVCEAVNVPATLLTPVRVIALAAVTSMLPVALIWEPETCVTEPPAIIVVDPPLKTLVALRTI